MRLRSNELQGLRRALTGGHLNRCLNYHHSIKKAIRRSFHIVPSRVIFAANVYCSPWDEQRLCTLALLRSTASGFSVAGMVNPDTVMTNLSREQL
jgi:hypothetical protein